MSVDQEVTKEKEQLEQNNIRLSKENEKDVLAGVIRHADGIEGDTEALDELQHTLIGYQLNSELKIAWVRQILLPDSTGHASAEQGTVDESELAVEFLLPSGDTFWRNYTLSPHMWEQDSEFVALLDQTNCEPATLDQLPGEQLDVTFEDDEWLLVGVETDRQSVDTDTIDAVTDTDNGVSAEMIVVPAVVFMFLFTYIMPLLIALGLPLLITGLVLGSVILFSAYVFK